MLTTFQKIACTICFVLPAACLTPHTTHQVPVASVLPWLASERIAPQQISRKLGSAHRSMEGGRILVWQLDEKGGSSRPYDDVLMGPYHLVVVLDRPELEHASIDSIRLVRTEAER